MRAASPAWPQPGRRPRHGAPADGAPVHGPLADGAPVSGVLADGAPVDAARSTALRRLLAFDGFVTGGRLERREQVGMRLQYAQEGVDDGR